MAKKASAIIFCGYRIEYSAIQTRWFVQDWDYELGYYTVGPSHPTKWAAMDWCEHRGI